ncbi:hypothetical protein JZU56_02805, partial [bacterium]|nr:hypothetical protein [bacterium]
MAYYPFNPTNFLGDVSGKLGPLTSPSLPTSQTSGPWTNSNSALFVQASSQYLKLPAMTLPDPFTVCHWYYITTGMTRLWNRLWDFGTDFQKNQVLSYMLDSSNHLRVAVYSGANGNSFYGPGSEATALVNNGLAETNTWCHICLGTNGRRFVLWKNDVLLIDDATGLSAARTVLSMANNYIGADQGLSAYWGGAFDEFRIYNRLLTNSEVSAVYNFRGDTNTSTMALSCSPTCSGTGVDGRCTPTGTPVCCAPGQYFVEGTSTACQPCPAGTYAPDGSATACTACGPGTLSAAGAAACAGVPAGSVALNPVLPPGVETQYALGPNAYAVYTFLAGGTITFPQAV